MSDVEKCQNDSSQHFCRQGMHLTKIVLGYYSFIESLWAEQKLSAEEFFDMEVLLGRLECQNLVDDCWSIQPWFIGQGGKTLVVGPERSSRIEKNYAPTI